MGRRQTTLLGNDPVVRFALLLRAVRGAANMTLRQVAQRSGYAHSTLATAESGKALPSWFVVEAFVRACDADPVAFQAMWNAVAGTATAPRQPLRDAPRNDADGAPVVPAQLPQKVARLSGRNAEMRRLTELVSSPRNGDAPPTQIVVIDGSAGIGKTELALHFANRVLDRYVDGQLYVDLRGFDPQRPAMPPGEALDHLLLSVGVDAAAIPRDLDQKAAMCRTAFAERRSIVVLDDAVSAEQLRPLLPGRGDSLVLVTSRNQLAGLGVRNNARRISLDVLDRADSVDLLRHALAGSAECADTTAAIRELARMCGDLPLALRIAAHRIVDNPMFTVGSFTRELARAGDRLSWLRFPGDPASDVRMALEQSYRALDTGAAQMFRLLASDDMSVISAESAADLAGAHPETGRHLLESLADAHMIERVAPWQYRLQELPRIFGRTVGRLRGAQGVIADCPNTHHGELYRAMTA